MEIRQLITFCKVAELGSFTKAADALFITQSAVSQQIRLLEKELGVSLFERKIRAIAITPAGQTLYGCARHILALHEETLRKLGQAASTVSGEVRIVASTIPGEHILPPLLSSFRQECPQIRVLTFIADSQRTLEEMRRSQADIGIVGLQPASPQLTCIPWLKDDLILIIPPDHRWQQRQAIGYEELKTEPFILREEGSGTRACIEQALKQRDLSPHDMNITLELGSTEAVKEAVRTGAGVSIVSRRAVKEELEKRQLQELKIMGLPMERAFYIDLHKKRILSPAACKLLEYLRHSSHS